MNARRALACAAAALSFVAPHAARAEAPGPAPAEEEPPHRVLAPPDERYAFADPSPQLSWAWFVFQILPSPEIGFGRTLRFDPTGNARRETETSVGLRWQVTPLLYSFGLRRGLSPWRVLVVDPIARVSGSLELYAGFDWFFTSLTTFLIRPGVRATFPLLQRGEYLAASLGTSVYRYDGMRVAYDVGIWTLSGFVGLETSVAPSNDALTSVTTLNIRVLH